MSREIYTHFVQESPRSARTELISAQNEYAHRFDGNQSEGIYRIRTLLQLVENKKV